MLNIGLNIKLALNGLIFSMRMKEILRNFKEFFCNLIRYLNTHYVKKRQTTELDNNYSFECNIDNNDPPLVEIGEVIFSDFFSFFLFFNFIVRWLLIVGQK
jgi:hypothetical protein